MNVAPSKRTHLMLLAAEGWKDALENGEGYFKRLAGASEVAVLKDRSEVTGKTVSAVTVAGELFIPLGDLVDFEKEIARLQKEMDRLNQEMTRARGKLANEGFVAKAPVQLVEVEKEKLAANEKKAAALASRIEELKDSL